MDTPGPKTTRRRLAAWFGDWVGEVGPASLRADLHAGVLGAVLVLPQAIAFATLAGLPPQVGLATAIVPSIVAALAGSSRHVVSGPTNTLSLALLGMLAPLAAVGSGEYVELAFAVTLLVGAIQWAVGALRLGALANFISPSVLQGFTAGAALLIALHATKDALGLALPAGLPAPSALAYLVTHAGQSQWSAAGVAAVTLAVAVGVRRLAPRWPAMLLALLAGAGTALAMSTAWGTAAVVRRVGDGGVALGSLLPVPHWPHIDWHRLPDLLGLAASITIIALGQSLAIAKALALRTGHRLDVNREFAGQGLSNLVGGMFGCYVSCGSLNRSVPNIEAGARTPLAAVFAALILLVAAAWAGPGLAWLPVPAIAALLLVVAWSLLDLPRWRRVFVRSRREGAIALATMLATLTLRLEIAILLGTILSLTAYLWRTSRPAMRTMGFDRAPGSAERPFVVLDDAQPGEARLPECPQLKLLRMEGSVYFGAVPYVAERLHELRSVSPAPKHLLVMAKSMNFVDLSAAEMWEAELVARRQGGGDLYFHRPRGPVLQTWRRTGLLDQLGADHVFPDKRTALAAVVPKLDPAICARCTARIFEECSRQPGPGGDAEVRPSTAAPQAPPVRR